MPYVSLPFVRICEVCNIAVFDDEPAPHTCDPKMVEVYQMVQATAEIMRFEEQLAEFLDSAEGKHKVLVAEFDRRADAVGKENQK